MLAIAELRQIALKMNRSGLQDIEIAGDHYRIHLRCDPTQPVTRSTSTASPAAMTTSAALPIAARHHAGAPEASRRVDGRGPGCRRCIGWRGRVHDQDARCGQAA